MRYVTFYLIGERGIVLLQRSIFLKSAVSFRCNLCEGFHPDGCNAPFSYKLLEVCYVSVLTEAGDCFFSARRRPTVSSTICRIIESSCRGRIIYLIVKTWSGSNSHPVKMTSCTFSVSLNLLASSTSSRVAVKC